MSKDKGSKWPKTEQNNLPFGDWIISDKNSENKPVLISRDDFLAQLEIQVNN